MPVSPNYWWVRRSTKAPYRSPFTEDLPDKVDPAYIDRMTAAYSPDTVKVANAIFNEERSEGVEAMNAAAWVIINRVKNKYHGEDTTLDGVLEKGIYGYNREDPVVVANGAPGDQEAWKFALETADKALAGEGEDPTGGKEYFINFDPALLPGFAVQGWSRDQFAQYLTQWASDHPGFEWLQFGTYQKNMFVMSDWHVMDSLAVNRSQ